MIIRDLVVIRRAGDLREHFRLVGEFVKSKVKTQEQLDSRLDALMTEYAMANNFNYDAKSRELRVC